MDDYRGTLIVSRTSYFSCRLVWKYTEKIKKQKKEEKNEGSSCVFDKSPLDRFTRPPLVSIWNVVRILITK